MVLLQRVELVDWCKLSRWVLTADRAAIWRLSLRMYRP